MKAQETLKKNKLSLDGLPEFPTGIIQQSREEDGLWVYGASRGAVTRVEYMVRQEGYIYNVKIL